VFVKGETADFSRLRRSSRGGQADLPTILTRLNYGSTRPLDQQAEGGVSHQAREPGAQVRPVLGQ